MGTATLIWTAVLRDLIKLSWFLMLWDWYCFGLISWFVPWIVVSNNCKALEDMHEKIIVILVDEQILPSAASWAKGSTDVKAKMIATTIEITICADNDAGLGSCSRLGFESWCSESFASRISSGWQIFCGELNEDLVFWKILRKVLVYGLTNKGLDEQRTTFQDTKAILWGYRLEVQLNSNWNCNWIWRDCSELTDRLWSDIAKNYSMACNKQSIFVRLQLFLFF